MIKDDEVIRLLCMVKISAMLEWNEAEAKVEIEHERQTPKCHEKKKISVVAAF